MAREGIPTVLSRYLVETRKRKELTQQIVADRIGVPQEELSKWERGVIQRPGEERMRRWAEAVGDPVGWVALAYLGIEPQQYTWPELKTEELSQEMVSLLNCRPSVPEAEYLYDSLQTLRRLRDRLLARYEAAREAGEAREADLPPATGTSQG